MNWTRTELNYLHRHGENKTAEELAKHFKNRSKRAVSQKARAEGVRLISCRGKRKFDDSLIAQVRQLLSQGQHTHSQIGAITGISTSYVSQIAIGKRSEPTKQKLPREVYEKAILKTQTSLNAVFCLH